MNKHVVQAFLDKRADALDKARGNAPHALPRVENLAGGSVTDFYIYDQIGGWDGILAKDVVMALGGVTGDIVLHISSGGGDVFEAMAIYNAFKNHKGNVEVRIEGVAASAASYIAMAADKVVIEANSTMMIHRAWGMVVGNEDDAHEFGDMLAMVSDLIAEMYALKAGGKPAEWRKKMAKDTWYKAQEAVAIGLADEVAGEMSAAALTDLSIFAYKTSPAEHELVGVTNSVPIPRTDDVTGIFAAFKEAIK